MKMPFAVSKIILHNRAPFEHIELEFTKNDIIVLNAVNGGGKTAILSHIVDAWHEMVRHGFALEFEGKEGKFYRVSSPVHNLNTDSYSLFYIRFCDPEQEWDYVDIRGKCTQQEYDEVIKLDKKIDFLTFQQDLDNESFVKKFSRHEKKSIIKVFNDNVITYFPAYRYEEPGYLNDPFSVKTKFSLEFRLSGYLESPIEVITGLPELANWIMDVLLDFQLKQPALDRLTRDLLSRNEQDENANIPYSMIVPRLLFEQISAIFTAALSAKSKGKFSVGIGNRNAGSTRIQIGERDHEGQWTRTVYPSIFNMSSGETALVVMFCEILRQFDKIKPNESFANATGIVLIDEIDKHLHVRLQKEILPKMFKLFPNIQFIISSHSPFVSLGLYDNASTKTRAKVIDLDKGGVQVEPSSTLVFQEAYTEMVRENERFHALYDDLIQKAKSDKLVIVSEGYNGKHIHRAITVLASELLDELEFSFSDKTGWQQLKNAYDAMSNSKQARYLFVFDCDCYDKVMSLQENGNFYVHAFNKRNDDCRAKVGIENLYPTEVLTDDLYVISERETNYGGINRISELDKNAVIHRIETDVNIAHFEHFKPLIKKIKSVLGITGDEATTDESALHPNQVNSASIVEMQSDSLSGE